MNNFVQAHCSTWWPLKAQIILGEVMPFETQVQELEL